METTMQLFSGMDYLRIDLANSFGLDKQDWDMRIDWVKSNETKLESLTSQAETPAMFLACLKAYRKAQNGVASGYPISLDACASGIQILSCASNCETSAALCGVIDTGHREDAYTNVHYVMQKANKTGHHVSRKDLKQAIMTSFYGSEKTPELLFEPLGLLDTFYECIETAAPGAWSLSLFREALWQP